MSKLATVVRAGLRSNFGLATIKYRILKEKKDRWLVPLFGLAALGVVPMFYGIVLLIQNVYYVLRPMGQERALLSFGILAGQLLILLFGIYYIIAAFYFARDLDLLIPLPLRPGEVMASKFAVVVINEYLTVAALVLPVVITLGVVAHVGDRILGQRGPRLPGAPDHPAGARLGRGRGHDALHQRQPEEGRAHPGRQPRPHRRVALAADRAGEIGRRPRGRGGGG